MGRCQDLPRISRGRRAPQAGWTDPSGVGLLERLPNGLRGNRTDGFRDPGSGSCLERKNQHRESADQSVAPAGPLRQAELTGVGSESIGRGMESRHEIALLTVACFLMLHAAAGHSTEASAAQATHEDRAVVSADLEYEIPDVQLVRDDGKRVSFRDEINDGRTVMLN